MAAIPTARTLGHSRSPAVDARASTACKSRPSTAVNVLRASFMRSLAIPALQDIILPPLVPGEVSLSRQRRTPSEIPYERDPIKTETKKNRHAPLAPHLTPPFTVDDFNDDENLAILRRCQRRIVELEAQIAQEKGIKKPASYMKSFTNMGRCIAKVVTTFGSLDSLIAENDRRMALEDKRMRGEDVHDEEEEPTVDQDRAFNGFKELMRFVPALRKPLFEADVEELTEILNALRNGSRNARSDDTKNIKVAIIPWLRQLFPDMVALDSDSRDDRGLYNDDIGEILCPIEYPWDDEEVRTKIREGDPLPCLQRFIQFVWDKKVSIDLTQICHGLIIMENCGFDHARMRNTVVGAEVGAA
ncbi:hypothetical protein B0H10DRAFT_1960556 [Mycena sp. CBHHK59/15]|nr:hypothetical protein B0H10DRAFT_1960556 [Mycena sp. CBHHK59/15]